MRWLGYIVRGWDRYWSGANIGLKAVASHLEDCWFQEFVVAARVFSRGFCGVEVEAEGGGGGGFRVRGGGG